MKQRLKGLLALVLSLVMVFATATSAWALEYNIYKEYDDNIGDEVYKLGVSDGAGGHTEVLSDTVFNADDTVTLYCSSGGLFVIKNERNEYVGDSNSYNYSVYEDYEDIGNGEDPILYAFNRYFLDGKYLFKEFGNTGYVDGSNYPVSYIHLVPVYTVTFDLQGYGTMTTATQTDIPKGDKVTEPNPAPSANGWTFGGWYKEAACTNAYDFNSAVNSSFTLYAKWTENSGGGPSEQEPSYNFPINFIPVDPKPDETVESPNTFDGGIASAVVVTILSATGGAWLAKKKD